MNSRKSRRTFLSDVGMGCAGLALGSLLMRDGIVRGEEGNALAQHPAKAKSVIWIFLVGGMSQMESFDPKPELTKYGGKTFEETPYKDALNSPHLKKNLREVIEGLHKVHPKIYPMQVGFKKYGQSGLAMSDWWSNLGKMADDFCLVRGMWTTDNNHGAQLQFHTGRHSLEGPFPTIGSWVHWGLGSLNDNLPQFVVMGTPIADCCGGVGAHGANYLGPKHDGVQLAVDPANPLPFGVRPKGVLPIEQKNEFSFIDRLNRLAAVEYPDDEQLQARIKSYELAFRMQMSAPEVLNLSEETRDVERLYGIDQEVTAVYGRRLLAARRLAERGVRFTLVYLSDYGEWDSHSNIKELHAKSCARVDKPLAGLIIDLKQRGMLDDTLVVCATEFGRTPALEITSLNKAGTGRDHHPHGFTVWMAGGGLKQGCIHGATDEFGFHAVEHPHYVTDIHSTVLHQLGLEPHRLAVPGRQRLEIDYGRVIKEILA